MEHKTRRSAWNLWTWRESIIKLNDITPFICFKIYHVFVTPTMALDADDWLESGFLHQFYENLDKVRNEVRKPKDPLFLFLVVEIGLVGTFMSLMVISWNKFEYFSLFTFDVYVKWTLMGHHHLTNKNLLYAELPAEGSSEEGSAARKLQLSDLSHPTSQQRAPAATPPPPPCP